MNRFVWLFLAAILFMVPALQAADPIGTISGTLNGDERTWIAVRLEGAGSTATYDEFMPGFTSIHIQGHEGGEFAIPKSLSIDFSLRKGGAIEEPAVIYLPGSDISDYYEAKDGALTIRLDRVEGGAETMAISGRASGTLVRTRREGLKFNVDDLDVIDIDVRFEATAHPSQ